MFDFIKQNPFLWLFIFLLIVSPSLLVGAFQVIAVIVLIVVALAVVGVLYLRWRVYKLKKQMGGEPQNGYSSYSNGSTSNRRTADGDADVKIYASPTEKRVADDVGDYVDFEELKSTTDEK